MDIIKIYNTVNKLIKQSGSKAKEQILKDNESDMEFREALKFLLNTYIVTGISTKKMKKKITQKKDVEIPCIRTFEDMIAYLKKNNSGRDIDVLAVKEYADQFELIELYDFILKFATKDLKLGISAKTVNKIYGEGTIPTFDVMLAESYAKKKDKLKGKFFITLKLDGNRCLVIKEDGEVKFYTRKGQEVEGLTQLANDFAELPDGYAYDGELLLVNKDNVDSAELFRATQKVVRKDGEKVDLEFHMFDFLPVDEFKKGISKKTYEQRRNSMETMFRHFDDGQFQFIKVLPVLYEGEDKSMINVYAKSVVEQGYEGIMINTANGLYQSKRVIDLMKVKEFKTADLLVMSIEKAIDGQFEGLLGRVNVEYKGNLVGVGSGFTLEQRKQFIDNPDDIVGKIIEVQFFEETKDEKTGQPSLRFPTFKGIRDDKGVEDINYGE